jgi:hypothetical protein
LYSGQSPFFCVGLRLGWAGCKRCARDATSCASTPAQALPPRGEHSQIQVLCKPTTSMRLASEGQISAIQLQALINARQRDTLEALVHRSPEEANAERKDP